MACTDDWVCTAAAGPHAAGGRLAGAAAGHSQHFPTHCGRVEFVELHVLPLKRWGGSHASPQLACSYPACPPGPHLFRAALRPGASTTARQLVEVVIHPSTMQAAMPVTCECPHCKTAGVQHHHDHQCRTVERQVHEPSPYFCGRTCRQALEPPPSVHANCRMSCHALTITLGPSGSHPARFCVKTRGPPPCCSHKVRRLAAVCVSSPEARGGAPG